MSVPSRRRSRGAPGDRPGPLAARSGTSTNDHLPRPYAIMTPTERDLANESRKNRPPPRHVQMNAPARPRPRSP
ncbi:hypothetical protein ACFQHO_34660 [Actinomadura yumaensis]|uniref:hypothetical protein n=1 Tax=Actinomadura yumaensis TaxID=111807 RepID=UPI00360D7C6F